MAFQYLLFLVNIFASVHVIDAVILGYTQSNGQSRLLGSSFGVPGINTTFDYVVSSDSKIQTRSIYRECREQMR